MQYPVCDVRIVFNMKKIITTIVALAMVLSLSGCKKPDPSGDNGSGSGNGNGNGVKIGKTAGSDNTAPEGRAGDVKAKIIIETDYLVFKIDSKIPLESDAWTGICPKGSYVYEDDADEAEISYSYCENRQSENDKYIFRVDYNDIEDGEYTIVLCNTDNSGYVVASWNLSIKNGKPEVDKSSVTVYPKPANLKPAEDPANPDVKEDENDDFDNSNGGYDGPYDDDGQDDGADDA